MNAMRIFLIFVITTGAIACNRNQPPGVPDTVGSTPVAAPAPKQPEPQPEQAAVAELPVPPPLDNDIPPFAKTGFPDCDNYIEEYRQCLNSRLAGDERKTAAHELSASVISITGNISRGVEPSRVSSRCKKARRMAATKLESYGCILQAQ